VTENRYGVNVLIGGVKYELIALQTETTHLVTKASFVLHKHLRPNSASELLFIIDRIANIEVWKKKSNICSWLLQGVDTIEGMINFAFITAVTTEKLHVLYVIGMQNISDRRFVTW
jgi:6-phosphogluconate dehydrogenase (decarboxylating)